MEELKKITSWIDNFELKESISKNEIMHHSVEAAKRVKIIAVHSLSSSKIKNFEGFDRTTAVLVGLAVRTWKLYDTLVFHVCKNQGEIAELLMRPLFETSVIFKYLLQKGTSSIQNYIFISYRSTAERLKEFRKQEEDKTLPSYGKRALEKIISQLNEDGISEEDLINNRNWRLDSKTFRDILKEVYDQPILYSTIFGAFSDAIHGQWKDIRGNNLRKKKDKYLPYLDYYPTDQRWLNWPSLITLDICRCYLEFNNMSPKEIFLPILNSLIAIIKKLEQKFEEMLNQQN